MGLPRLPTFPPETPLDERDGRYLRKAIVWSHAARRRGNRPFGAVIVSAGGQVLAEAWCNTTETSDVTGHAATNAVRMLAGRGLRHGELAAATVYCSTEPCVMCAGAICWCRIGRVVFGIDAGRLRMVRGEASLQPGAAPSCRDVFAGFAHAVECLGPALINEAMAAHIGAWQA